MNAERRHELQQNDLADLLGVQLKKIESHSKLIAAVIVVVVVAAVAWALYRSAAVGTRSDATLELLQNSATSDPEALGSVGERFSDTTAGTLAKLYQADTLLAAGIASLFDDREEAQTQLTEAVRRYEEAAQATKDPVISSRANFGSARAHESLGQTDNAVAAYNRVISIGESEAIVNVAQQHIDRLKSPGTQEFLAWFAKQDFRPADPSQPPPLPSGISLPDFPDLDLPDVSPLNVPDELRGATTDGEAPGAMTLPQTDTADATTEPAAAPATVPEPAPATVPEPAPATDPEPAPAADSDATPAGESAEAADTTVEPVVETEPRQ
jgi:hypothetical protein